MTTQKLQAVRDQIFAGDEVLVRPRNTQGVVGVERRGRVTEIHGAMAAINFDNKKTEMVALTRLSKIVDTHELFEAPPTVRTRTIAQPVSAPKPLALPPVAASPAAAPTPQDDVTAWFEMGRAIAVQMREQIAQHRSNADDLREEANTLLETAKSFTAKADQLAKQLVDVERISGGQP